MIAAEDAPPIRIHRVILTTAPQTAMDLSVYYYPKQDNVFCY